ncbi:hypothetical protein F4781DRAFT_416305 [Annulohypoxylon bovei var. microspora]|nr:hypothetical protein F4781DRAFT_416305 [Annulohypoxylon bovei var. microspora]
MSFGFGVGDFIAGANLAHKLIRVMTETRGATAEFQEALAEVCGIQQIFIQLTQLCRSEILPRATLNSIAQIIMPSMTTIADFLDRTKHYQEKLSPSGGLSGSWCKMGWALFRKDELKILRDTLHSRLSSINTLLTAANHLPPSAENIAQYQVKDENQESRRVSDWSTSPSANFSGHTKPQERISVLYEQTPTSVQPPTHAVHEELNGIEIDVANDIPEGADDQTLPFDDTKGQGIIKYNDPPNAQNHIKALGLVNSVVGFPRNVEEPTESSISTGKQQSQHEVRFPARHMTKAQSLIPPQTLKELTTQKSTPGDLQSYLQVLFEKALVVQADAEAKAEAQKKAADDAEWKQRMEEVIRIQAEIDVKKRLEIARVEAEKKAYIKFKDAVGRKFNFPYNLCITWQGMEELIKQAFIHVDVIGPHVRAGHYDLIGPSGEIILPQAWARVIEPDWAITMHMWPMDRTEHSIPPPKQPSIHPPSKDPELVVVQGPDSDDDCESEHSKRFSLRTYFNKKMKRFRGRDSSKDEDGWGSDSSASIRS